MENVCFTCTHQELPINFSLKQSQLRILTLGIQVDKSKSLRTKQKQFLLENFTAFVILTLITLIILNLNLSDSSLTMYEN